MTTKLFRVLRNTPGDNFRFAAPSRSDYIASSKHQLSSTCLPASANIPSSHKNLPNTVFIIPGGTDKGVIALQENC